MSMHRIREREPSSVFTQPLLIGQKRPSALYTFFCEPLHKSHSCIVKTCSVVAFGVLSVISLGFYPLGISLLKNRISHGGVVIRPASEVDEFELTQTSSTTRAPALSFHLQRLKTKAAEHLVKLRKMANQRLWNDIGIHTHHPDSAMDWWRFPIATPGKSCPIDYSVTREQVEILKQDVEFMANYREGVALVARSWGWDVTKAQAISYCDSNQKWTGYDIRVAKMVESLIYFGQEDLLRSMTAFIDQKVGREYLAQFVSRIQSLPLIQAHLASAT